MTTITALSDLTDLSFLRAIDPDMPSSTFTLNNRGYGSLSENDWVNSENEGNGLTLGLYSNSDVTHNTGITNFTTNHSDYLSGTDLGDGDNTIGLAFDLGDLAAGSSIDFDYYYVMGDTPDSVDIPDMPTIPEPSIFALFLLGLMGLGIRRFKNH
ncbi:MAG: PEP-CTERM sorting domain-containing protein [Alteromonadaceae bacterium]|nr:PEP-CTERM sorting domain-containing protein [Alteromonadaceae bacterium]